MVAASLQGMATGGEEVSTAGFFCSEEGVCKVANTSTVMVLAQGIEMVINNSDLVAYLVAAITLWELAWCLFRRLYKWLWVKKAVVIPASGDCDVLRYSQPRAKTLCKHCLKDGWVVNAEFLGEERAAGT